MTTATLLRHIDETLEELGDLYTKKEEIASRPEMVVVPLTNIYDKEGN